MTEQSPRPKDNARVDCRSHAAGQSPPLSWAICSAARCVDPANPQASHPEGALDGALNGAYRHTE